MTDNKRKRVIFAGIDGATFSIIDPMIADGKLPNLAAMQNNGTMGPLLSTNPPNSSLAYDGCPSW
jgi:predicted AlkP superfamily phosphohydrolase/phosphomutase